MPRISIVCTTGSTELNSRLRAELLWRMVNSAHADPGHPFELILVDNSQGGAHREAICNIFNCYESVTHIIKNRLNERHGGGVTQGMKLADGDILIQVTDDLEWEPRWLEDLIRPLLEVDGGRFIAAPLKGHNSRSRLLRNVRIDGRLYDIRTNAAAYCWAFHRAVWDDLGPMRRAHFADTRWSNRAYRRGYRFVLPTWRIAKETNLNYLRPWDYRKERGMFAQALKFEHLDHVWNNGLLMNCEPEKPPADRPLKNPKNIGPGAYPPGWIADQEVAGDA